MTDVSLLENASAGTAVEIFGLVRAPELNGQRGVLNGKRQGDRFGVILKSVTVRGGHGDPIIVALRPANLRLVKQFSLGTWQSLDECISLTALEGRVRAKFHADHPDQERVVCGTLSGDVLILEVDGESWTGNLSEDLITWSNGRIWVRRIPGGFQKGEMCYYIGADRTYQSGDHLRHGTSGIVSGICKLYPDMVLVQFEGLEHLNSMPPIELSGSIPQTAGNMALGVSFEVGDMVLINTTRHAPEGQVKVKVGLSCHGRVGRLAEILTGAEFRTRWPEFGSPVDLTYLVCVKEPNVMFFSSGDQLRLVSKCGSALPGTIRETMVVVVTTNEELLRHECIKCRLERVPDASVGQYGTVVEISRLDGTALLDFGETGRAWMPIGALFSGFPGEKVVL